MPCPNAEYLTFLLMYIQAFFQAEFRLFPSQLFMNT